MWKGIAALTDRHQFVVLEDEVGHPPSKSHASNSAYASDDDKSDSKQAVLADQGSTRRNKQIRHPLASAFEAGKENLSPLGAAQSVMESKSPPPPTFKFESPLRPGRGAVRHRRTPGSTASRTGDRLSTLPEVHIRPPSDTTSIPMIHRFR